MAKVFLTERALADINDIYEYSLNKWGLKTADHYLEGIQETIILLQNHPELLTQKKQISKRFKIYPSQRHWLICDLIDTNIYLLTVKHSSINLLERLKLLEPDLDMEANILYQRLEKR